MSTNIMITIFNFGKSYKYIKIENAKGEIGVCVCVCEREREREREINPSSVFKEQLIVIMWITSTITRKTTDDG